MQNDRVAAARIPVVKDSNSAGNDNVIRDGRPAGAYQNRLNTVWLRLRVTATVMIVLAVMLVLLSIAA